MFYSTDQVEAELENWMIIVNEGHRHLATHRQSAIAIFTSSQLNETET